MQWHSINLPPDIQKKHHAIASCSIATQPMNAAYKQPKYGLIIACPLTDGYNKLNGILLADIRKNQDIDSIRVLPPNHMFTGVNEQGIAYTSEANDDWMAVGVSAFDKTGKQQWHYPLTKSPSNIIMNPLPGGKLVIAYHFYPPNQRAMRSAKIHVDIISSAGKLEEQLTVTVKPSSDQAYFDINELRLITLGQHEFILSTPTYFNVNGKERMGTFLFEHVLLDQKKIQPVEAIVPITFQDIHWNFTPQGELVLAGYNADIKADPDKSLPQLQLAAYDVRNGQIRWVTDIKMPQSDKGFTICNLLGLEKSVNGSVMVACFQQTFENRKPILKPDHDKIMVLNFDAQGKEINRYIINHPKTNSEFLYDLIFQGRERRPVIMGQTSDNQLLLVFGSLKVAIQNIAKQDGKIFFKILKTDIFQGELK